MRNRLLSLIAVAMLTLTAAHAQEVHAGGGFTIPSGDMSNSGFTTGGNFVVGGGFNFLPHVELMAEYMHDTFGTNNNFVFNNGNGNAHVDSIVVNPVIKLGVPTTKLGAYVTGGVGFYHRNMSFTDAGFNQTDSAIGYNIGGGVTYKIFGPASLYGEVRYHDAFTSNGHTQFVPITFGIRF